MEDSEKYFYFRVCSFLLYLGFFVNNIDCGGTNADRDIDETDEWISSDLASEDLIAEDLALDEAEEEISPLAWLKTYNYREWEEAHDIQQTSDSGYIVSGRSGTRSDNQKVWIFKIDANGNIVWQKIGSGEGGSYALSIRQTSDGGYIASGYIWPSEGGGYDALVIKIDENGGRIWYRSYGGEDEDWAYSVLQTSDSGYIAAGRTKSFGTGEHDIWVFKLDQDGNVVWQKIYGQAGHDDYAHAIQQTADSGFIIAGLTVSTRLSDNDFWILKLDPNGNVIWQKAYGNIYDDIAYSIIQTSDEEYIVAGKTCPNGEDSSNIWILKLDASGNIIWQKIYERIGYDEEAHSINPTSDGGYIIGGFTDTSGFGTYDSFILKLGENGNVIWQMNYGTEKDDLFGYVQQTSDQGYVMAGYKLDFYNSSDDSDILILKLDEHGSVSEACQLDIGVDIPTVGSDTSITSIDTSVLPKTTNAIVADINLSLFNTNTVVETLCSQ